MGGGAVVGVGVGVGVGGDVGGEGQGGGGVVGGNADVEGLDGVGFGLAVEAVFFGGGAVGFYYVCFGEAWEMGC